MVYLGIDETAQRQCAEAAGVGPEIAVEYPSGS
jgi:hypothetical protein